MPKTPRILSCGCGEDTYGTDFVDLYPTRPNVLKRNLCEDRLPYPDNTFDEVYANGIFSMLYNPLFFLKEARRVLKKGGVLRIIDANAGFGALFSNTFYGGYNKRQHGRDDLPYFLSTPATMRNWLAKVGFTNPTIRYSTPSPTKDRSFEMQAKAYIGKLMAKAIPRLSSCLVVLAKK